MKKILLISSVFLGSVTAEAQNVFELDKDTKVVSDAQSGQYDRIEEAWSLMKNTTYLVSFPAFLDGYYFGPDAKRMKVVSYEISEGKYIVTTADMDDLEDFLPNEAYLVTPSVDVDKIVHVTPGIKTSAQATPEGKELLHVDQGNIKSGIQSLFANGNEANGSTCIYDIQGRKVSVVRKGETYIMNGKKVLFK